MAAAVRRLGSVGVAWGLESAEGRGGAGSGCGAGAEIGGHFLEYR